MSYYQPQHSAPIEDDRRYLERNRFNIQPSSSSHYAINGSNPNSYGTAYSTSTASTSSYQTTDQPVYGSAYSKDQHSQQYSQHSLQPSTNQEFSQSSNNAVFSKYSKDSYSLGYGSSSMQGANELIIEHHMAPSQPRGSEARPSFHQSNYFQASSTPDTPKDIRQRVMNNLGKSNLSLEGSNEKYDAYYTSFYGMNAKEVTESGAPANVDAKFAYLYQGFKPKKGSKFNVHRGKVPVPNSMFNEDADKLERPAFQGASSRSNEKMTESVKARHERYQRMMRSSENELSNQSHRDQSPREHQGFQEKDDHGQEYLIYSALDTNFDQVMKLTSVTSEQRISELITALKATLNKLDVPSNESQFYFETFLKKIIKAKNWKALTPSAALFISVSPAQKMQPLDPSEAAFRCTQCKLSYPPEKFQCFACDRKFMMLPDLYVHEFDAHGHLSANHTMCTQCYAVFPKNPVALRAHYKVNHICERNHAECPFGCKTLILENHSRSLPDHVFSMHACVECNDLLSGSLEKHASLFHDSVGKSPGTSRTDDRSTKSIGDTSRESPHRYQSEVSKKRSREEISDPYGNDREDSKKLLKDYSKSQYEEYLSRGHAKEYASVSESRKQKSSPVKEIEYGSSWKAKKTPASDPVRDEMYEKAKTFIDSMFTQSSAQASSGKKELLSAMEFLESTQKKLDPLFNSKYPEHKQESSIETIPTFISRKGDGLDDNPFKSLPKSDSVGSRYSSSKSVVPDGKSSMLSLEEEVNQLFSKSKKTKSHQDSTLSKSSKRIRAKSRSRSPRVVSDKYRTSGTNSSRKRSSSPRGRGRLREHQKSRDDKYRKKSRSRDKKQSSSFKKTDNQRVTPTKSTRSRGSSKDNKKYASGGSRISSHMLSSGTRDISPGDLTLQSSQSVTDIDSEPVSSAGSVEICEVTSRVRARSKSIEEVTPIGRRARARNTSLPPGEESLEPVSPERPGDLCTDSFDVDAVSTPGSPISDTDLDVPEFKMPDPSAEEKATWTRCKLCSLSCPPNGGFKCNECPKMFILCTEMYIHMQDVHSTVLQSKWECDFCGTVFDQVFLLDSHLKDQHLCHDDHMQCEQGCAMLLIKKNYEIHCDNNHGFFCDLCNIQCIGSKSQHLAIEHNDDLDDFILTGTETHCDSDINSQESSGDEAVDNHELRVIVDSKKSSDDNESALKGDNEGERKDSLAVDDIQDVDLDYDYEHQEHESISICEVDTPDVDIEAVSDNKNSGLESIEITELLDDVEDLSDAELDSISDTEIPLEDIDISDKSPPVAATNASPAIKDPEMTIIDLSPYEEKESEKTYLHVVINRAVFGECLFVKITKEVLMSQSRETLEKSGLIFCKKCPLVYHPMLMRCNSCELYFLDEAALADHAISVHKCEMDGESVDCRFCEASFNTYEEVIKHRAKHFCPEHVECNKGCTSVITGNMQHLRKHVATYHSDKEQSLILGHVTSDVLKSATQQVEPLSEDDMIVCADCPVAIPSNFEIICEVCPPESAKRFYVVDEYMEHKLVLHKVTCHGYFRCMLCKDQPNFIDDITGLIDHKHKVHGVCVRHSKCPELQCGTLKAHGKLMEHLGNQCRFFKAQKAPAVPLYEFSRKEVRYCEECTLGVLTSEVYKCTLCAGLFPLLREFYAHMFYDHERPVPDLEYKCDMCDAHREPVSAGRWRQHRLKSHKVCRTHFSCPNIHCQLLFSSISALSSHLQSSEKCKDKPSTEPVESLGHKKCNKCDVVKPETFRRACQLCFNKIFVDDLEFILHLATKHRKRFSAFLECDKCSVLFNDASQLASHRYINHKMCQTHVFCTSRGGTACGFIVNLLQSSNSSSNHECVFDFSELTKEAPDLLWDDENAAKCKDCPFILKTLEMQKCKQSGCTSSFVSSLELAAHNARKHGWAYRGYYECLKCVDSRNFRGAPDRLLEHYKSVHDHCLFHRTCANRGCKSLFNSKSDLSEHLSNCRSQGGLDVDSIELIDDGDSPLPINSKETWKKHLSAKDSKVGPKTVDLNEFKLFHCNRCSRKFGTSSLLECNRCVTKPSDQISVRYINKDEYNAHVSVDHSLKLLGEYKCPVCSDVFSDDPIKLTDHLSTAHSFCRSHCICPHQCLTLFGDQFDLQDHLQKHHNSTK